MATKGQSGNDLDTVSKQDVERVAKRYIRFASFLLFINIIVLLVFLIMQGNRVKQKLHRIVFLKLMALI